MRYFGLLKEFGYIERVVKSDFFIGKVLFHFICAQHVLSYHFTMVLALISGYQSGMCNIIHSFAYLYNYNKNHLAIGQNKNRTGYTLSEFESELHAHKL